MSRDPKIENIVRLMMAFHFHSKAAPGDLKCAQCRSVMADACQVSCGCRFCRDCIDRMEESGSQFCPGKSQECGDTPLSTAAPDDNANTSISRLSFKCPLYMCSHESPLADMEDHLRACPRKTVGGIFPNDRTISFSERQMKWIIGNYNVEMEEVKRELALKEEQKRKIKGEMKRAQENQSKKGWDKSMKEKVKLLELEIKVLREQEKELEEELELEVRVRDDPGPFLHKGVTALSGGPRADWGFMLSEMRSEHMRSAGGGAEPQQVPAGRERGDTSYHEWLIEVPLGETPFGSLYGRSSDRWVGQARPYTYELGASNDIVSGWLKVWLRVHAPPADSSLEWPITAAVTVTVSDRRKRAASTSQMRQCVVEKPKERGFNRSGIFVFQYSALKAARVDLMRGVRLSCQIVHNEGQ